jgi:uncharacterized protein YpuA (DUF1002 family)
MMNQDARPAEYRELSISEAAYALDISNTQLYNEIKENGWEKTRNKEGRSKVLVPVSRIKKEPAAQASPESNSATLQQVAEILERNYEARLRDMQTLIDTQHELIQSKKSQWESLNNEMSALQNQLISLREKVKDTPPPKRKWSWRFWD